MQIADILFSYLQPAPRKSNRVTYLSQKARDIVKAGKMAAPTARKLSILILFCARLMALASYSSSR